MRRLAGILDRLDGKSYKAYKDLQGMAFEFPDYNLRFLHVQGDPFASLSRVALRLEPPRHGLDSPLWSSPDRRRAVCDFLQRRLYEVLPRRVKGRRGSGHSGRVEVARPGQQVLWRSGVQMDEGGTLELRLGVGLPAAGRRILGREAQVVLFEELPALVREAVLETARSPAALEAHIRCLEDQVALRRWLAEHGFVAFVADGSVLPRRSGVDDRPLEGAVPFAAPDTLAVEVDLPHGGRIRGMAVPAGVTLIVGGGYHGKSTLLHALERGVYDHVPGDGRERVVSLERAVKVRAEDGRAIHPIDIRPFIDHLPLGRETRHFASDDASGSTSQAAAILEALDAGARLLFIDEDTSATNFMIRDARMQALVHPEQEPITPFIARVRELYHALGVSTVLVMGGSGDYFAVADTVIQMDQYQAVDVTTRARLLGESVAVPQVEGRPPLARHPDRGVDLRGRFATGRAKVEVREGGVVRLDGVRLDLSALAQVVEPGQLRAIGWLVRRYGLEHAGKGLGVWAGELEAMLDGEGLDGVSDWPLADLSRPRVLDVIAAVNRLRGA